MLGRNVLVGLFSSIWSAALGFAVIPFYLKYLGVEAYGLIGFFATAQAMFQLLDMGLASTLNREVARRTSTHSIGDMGPLLHTLSVVYWCLAFAIALASVAAAPLVAKHWLRANGFSTATLQHIVMLLGLVIACRWPVGLYQGALIGAQRISLSSGANIVMGTLSSVGSLVILAFVSPTIEAFFIWQAVVGLAYAALVRHLAWTVVGARRRLRFNMTELRRIWRFSAGMAAITMLGLVFSQLDKVILSRALPLAEFGRYVLASTVVSALYIAVGPMFNALFPRLSGLIAAGETAQVEAVYRLCTRTLAAVLFPLAMTLILFSRDIVQLWTGDATLAAAIAPVIALLAAGSALHGVMHVPHALQLAYGRTTLPMLINSILMVVLVPLIIALSLMYGALGGAAAWLILHVLYVALGSYLTHRSLPVGLPSTWLLQDLGIPMAVSVAAGVGFSSAATATGASHGARLGLALAAAVVAAMATVALSPAMRLAIFKRLAAHASARAAPSSA